MKKLFTTVALALLSHLAHTQCSTGVAAYTSGTNYNNSNAISTVQTFQVGCTGILKNVVVNHGTTGIAAASLDDVRGTGYAVGVRIRSASGTLLATSQDSTDQWWAGMPATTFDFTCANLMLAAGTTYQLEFYQTFSGIPFNGPKTPFALILFLTSNTASIYAGGNMIADGTSYPNRDLYGWTVNLTSGSIAPASANASMILKGLSCNTFYNSSNDAIVNVASGSTAMGSTTVKVFVQSTAPQYRA